MGDVLYIVVPCYNEEAVLPETQKELGNKLETMITAGAVSEKSRIIFVDDGSKDKTWELIEKYHSENPRIGGVKLAHNRGHQFAVLAGLMTVKDLCDMAITMDADLQDDIDVVDKFVEKYKEGCIWSQKFPCNGYVLQKNDCRRILQDHAGDGSRHRI